MDKKILKNTSKNTTLGEVRFANTFFSRFRGLMLKKDLNDGGLVLEIPAGRGRSGSAIHMFFMRIPLDIIFTDENLKIVDIATCKPWTMYTPREAARNVIELEVGTVEKSNTEIGDVLEYQ